MQATEDKIYYCNYVTDVLTLWPHKSPLVHFFDII